MLIAIYGQLKHMEQMISTWTTEVHRANMGCTNYCDSPNHNILIGSWHIWADWQDCVSSDHSNQSLHAHLAALIISNVPCGHVNGVENFWPHISFSFFYFLVGGSCWISPVPYPNLLRTKRLCYCHCCSVKVCRTKYVIDQCPGLCVWLRLQRKNVG